ncbi:A-kinase anchor protein 10, mitochondrial isoform X2 [Ischnura elegans]|uniref:A-kinase anchor protein 10, mitochondrial isoform X2 n=1 Tax=Ischnura elegans TaxID=197161 RepID=UPI001ED869DF|nr:A-kinase anchor protein 10, mitochondrial isoform X2 [Ischnura elegans]
MNGCAKLEILDEESEVCALERFVIVDMEKGTEAESSNGNLEDEKVIKGQSRLWMTLSQVLEDRKGALVHFSKFMESLPSGGALLRFWLDTKAFQEMAPKSSDEAERLSLGRSNSSSISINRTTNPVNLKSPTKCDSPGSVVSSTTSPQFSPLVPVLEESECSSGGSSKTDKEASKCANVPVTPAESPGEVSSDSCTSRKGISLSLSLLNEDGVPMKCGTGGYVAEAVRIFRIYVAQDAPMQVGLSNEIRNAIVDAICRPGGDVDYNCFVEAQTYVYSVMENQYFNDFLNSEYHCQHQVDILTSGRVLLDDILYCETALFHFMEFLEQEGKQGLLLEFWLAANNFQLQLAEQNGCYNPDEAQDDAIILYDKYFSLQATNPLGVSAAVRLEVEQNICREGGPLPTCFNKPMAIVHRALERRHLAAFLSSQLFYQLLSELVNSKHHPAKSPGAESGKESRGSQSSQSTPLSSKDLMSVSGSDAETPHSNPSTLPAKKVVRNVDGREMTIDSQQLYDPDSLWRRRQKSGLCFGRINEMGRFETDIEPEPDRKGESRITKVVKKLVNMDEDKAKEDMAWQIAEMIVKDITSLTLGGSDEEVSDATYSNQRRDILPTDTHQREGAGKGLKS